MSHLACTGCGRPLEELTPNCPTCSARFRKRLSRERRRAEADLGAVDWDTYKAAYGQAWREEHGDAEDPEGQDRKERKDRHKSGPPRCDRFACWPTFGEPLYELDADGDAICIKCGGFRYPENLHPAIWSDEGWQRDLVSMVRQRDVAIVGGGKAKHSHPKGASPDRCWTRHCGLPRHETSAFCENHRVVPDKWDSKRDEARPVRKDKPARLPMVIEDDDSARADEHKSIHPRTRPVTARSI